MTQEEKDLLLKDLCARLPYGVKVKTPYNDAILRGIVDRKGVKTTIDYTDIATDKQTYPIRYIKPYLRPMSSMTKKEKNSNDELLEKIYKMPSVGHIHVAMITDWLLERHFDIHDLISKGLALEAPEGMYNLKEKSPSSSTMHP